MPPTVHHQGYPNPAGFPGKRPTPVTLLLVAVTCLAEIGCLSNVNTAATHTQTQTQTQTQTPCTEAISLSPFSVRILYNDTAIDIPAGQAPPKVMPDELKLYYTRCGKIPIADMYIDDTNNGVGTHYQYPRNQIRTFIKEAKAMKKSGRTGKYAWLYAALKAHPIKQQHVVLFGSMEPWFEAICLAHGAASVTVIEYNRLTYDYPKIRTYTPAEHAQIQPPPIYSVAFAMSAFDHDGLGRYGDPLHPDQDLRDMDMVRSMLSPSGLFFLTVAIGSDLVVWNLGRRYGELRLPLLLHGWDTLDITGWDEKRANADSNYRQRYEPVFVLTPKQALPQEQLLNTETEPDSHPQQQAESQSQQHGHEDL